LLIRRQARKMAPDDQRVKGATATNQASLNLANTPYEHFLTCKEGGQISTVELAYKFGDNRQTIFLDEGPDSAICNGEWIGSLSGITFLLVCSKHSKDNNGMRIAFIKNRGQPEIPQKINHRYYHEGDNP
jgi:hypothetical protein